MTRRTLLGILNGTVRAGLAGGYAISRGVTPHGLARSVLERHLGPLRMDAVELDTFVAEFVDRRAWLVPTGKLASGYQSAHDIGMVEQARMVLQEDDAYKLEQFERRLLGDFFTQTTFGYSRGPDDAVVFVGATGCLNPFAKFEADTEVDG